MLFTRDHRESGYRLFGVLVGLLILLIPPTEAWPQGKGVQVTVHDGRLSVNVQESDLGEVLAQIGRQADIRMVAGPSSGKKVSAQFADIELEDGIRRLLRLASLSHLFLHAQGPAGKVILSEVRVFRQGQDTRSDHATVSDRSPIAEPRFPQPIPRVVEPVQQPTPEPESVEPTELTRRVREVFRLSKEMGRPVADEPEASPQAPTPQSPAPEGTGVGSR